MILILYGWISSEYHFNFKKKNETRIVRRAQVESHQLILTSRSANVMSIKDKCSSFRCLSRRLTKEREAIKRNRCIKISHETHAIYASA